jgi:propanol-preferring alcohol dehydrogenase
MGIGFGQDGGMADAMLVPDCGHLVPIGDLDPVRTASLTDAGLITANILNAAFSAPRHATK